jgi:hypothetical protein
MEPLYYFKDSALAPSIEISIDKDFKVTIRAVDVEGPVVVQLASDKEAQTLIAEFKDPDGELMYEVDSICGKYPELHQFRP